MYVEPQPFIYNNQAIELDTQTPNIDSHPSSVNTQLPSIDSQPTSVEPSSRKRKAYPAS